MNFYHLPGGKKIYHLGRRQLAKVWARWHRARDIIMITGSYGKTSTAYVLEQFLGRISPTLATDRNLDTIYNLPQTLLRWRKQKWLVLETGIDHRGEMDFHLDLIKPTVVVFMGITPVHAEPGLLGSKKQILAEKSKLVKSLGADGLLIYNADDDYVRRAARSHKGQKLSFSLDKRRGQYYLENSRVTFRGTYFRLRSRPSGAVLNIKTRLLGRHFGQSFLAAFALAEARDLPLKALEKAARGMKPLSGRLSLEKFINGSWLLNDSLRSNPASAKAGLAVAVALRGKQSRLVIVMGEMGELGRYASEEHRNLGRQLDRLKPDILVAIGPLMRLAAAEIKNGITKIIWAADPVTAAEQFQRQAKAQKGDLFYLKGSLLRHLERFNYILKGQRVSCRRSSCHRYKPCVSCPFLLDK